MLTVTVILFNWTSKNEYTPKRWREGASIVNYSRKGRRLILGTIEA